MWYEERLRGESLGSPDRFNNLGVQGPNIVVSNIPVHLPSLAIVSVRLT